MNQDKLINLQGRTITDFTFIVIAGGNAQAIVDWRARLMHCAAMLERAIRDQGETDASPSLDGPVPSEPTNL